MTDNKHLEIDFSEAKILLDFLSVPLAHEKALPDSAQCEVWGFSAPKHVSNASGPCALGTVLHFHEIGWNHLPKEKNGRPVNNPFIEELMRWSETPNLPLSMFMGTTPDVMLKALRKAGLTASWYAHNKPEATLELIKKQLAAQRPVIALIQNHETEEKSELLEWQVVFKILPDGIYTKYWTRANAEHIWTIDEFKKRLQNQRGELNCSVITAEKS